MEIFIVKTYKMGKRLIISEEERSEIRGKYNLIKEDELMPLSDYLKDFGYKVCALPQSFIPFVKGKQGYTVYCNSKKVYFLYYNNGDKLEGLNPPEIKGKTFYGDNGYNVIVKYK